MKYIKQYLYDGDTSLKNYDGMLVFYYCTLFYWYLLAFNGAM